MSQNLAETQQQYSRAPSSLDNHIQQHQIPAAQQSVVHSDVERDYYGGPSTSGHGHLPSYDQFQLEVTTKAMPNDEEMVIFHGTDQLRQEQQQPAPSYLDNDPTAQHVVYHTDFEFEEDHDSPTTSEHDVISHGRLPSSDSFKEEEVNKPLDEYSKLRNGEGFLKHDTGLDDPDRILFFTTQKNLELLKASAYWGINRVSKFVPRQFVYFFATPSKSSSAATNSPKGSVRNVFVCGYFGFIMRIMIVLFAMLTLGEAICRSKEIPIGTMPNTVQILVRGYDGQPLIICGGVIISENMFIVAAHCDSTEDYEGKFHHDIIRSTAIVKYGSERKNKGNIIKVMETIIHQRFDKEHRKPETLEEQMKFLRNSEYDVAIVIIEGEFLAYKGKIGVVDIDPYCFYDGMSAIFTGFGRYDAKENASQNAEQLRFAKAYPFHQGNFSSIGFSTAHITESDSGSGVFVARNETLFLIGIQQSSIVQDGVRLGVFLELKNFNPWIKSIMNKGKDDLKNGKEDLKNGKEDLKNGKEDLKNGKEDLKNGKKDLKNGKEDLKNGKKDLKNGKEDLNNGKEDLKNGKEDLKNGKDEL